MNKKDWIIVIILMIVIGVGASLLTSKMTGNAINVSPATTSQQVYTKAEVDSLRNWDFQKEFTLSSSLNENQYKIFFIGPDRYQVTFISRVDNTHAIMNISYPEDITGRTISVSRSMSLGNTYDLGNFSKILLTHVVYATNPTATNSVEFTIKRHPRPSN